MESHFVNCIKKNAFLNQNIVNFEFRDIVVNGDKRFAYSLKNKILIYSQDEAEKEYDIIIDLKNSKKEKIKDATGRIKRYSLILTADLSIKNVSNQIVNNKFFSIENDYDVLENHAETIKNEKNAIQNNIDKLSDEIIKYIQLINLK